MANMVFNVAKGRVVYYATLPGSNDGLIAVPIEAAGLVDDSTMIDYATLSAVLNAASNEQAVMGRVTLSAVTATVNNTDNRVQVDAANPVWTAPSGDPVAALLICYQPDLSVSDDTLVIPLVKLDFNEVPDGSTDITAVFGATGFYWAV